MGAAVLFLQLFHNDGEERPANIDQGQESVQAFMGWVSSIGIDTHIVSLLDTWSDTMLTGEFHSFLPSLPDSAIPSLPDSESSTERGDCMVSLWLWLRHLISLNLSSFICKMRKVIATLAPSQACDVQLRSCYM